MFFQLGVQTLWTPNSARLNTYGAQEKRPKGWASRELF